MTHQVPLTHLKISKENYSPAIREHGESFYRKFIFKGGDLTPRNFWFVDIKPDAFLGFDPQNPFIISSENRASKAPWKEIGIQGKIKKDFLFNTVLASNIVPFAIEKRRLVFLPIFF